MSELVHFGAKSHKSGQHSVLEQLSRILWVVIVLFILEVELVSKSVLALSVEG